ncbi:MAG: Gldg family protein [Sphingobacteriia bacterium]|nr:Gldg family protein [Sphingobacteriia bacterium]
MKAIYRIAKLELASLFYSPVAWLVLIVFSFQSGVVFTGLLKGRLQTQDLGVPQEALGFWIFNHAELGFFASMQGSLYLYLPLLTMGLFAREYSTGSIKLLLSSPVSVAEIVLGKFFAMMAFNLLLVLVLGAYVLTGSLIIQDMAIAQQLCALLGCYLLICAYAAIGLFMSSLTSYHVVAAISTLVTLAGLSYLLQVGQEYGWMRSITYFLSLSGRTVDFYFGLISSKNVLYFLLVIVLFLGLCYNRLQAQRYSKSQPLRLLRSIILIGSALVLGIVSTEPSLILYKDTTANQSLTISQESQTILKAIPGPITVTMYVNAMDQDLFKSWGVPEQRNKDKRFWQLYTRFRPDMEFKYVYYYDTLSDASIFRQHPGKSLQEVAELVVDVNNMQIRDFLPPDSMHTIGRLLSEKARTVREISAGGRYSFLRFYNDAFHSPNEREVIAAFRRLIEPSPKIFFTSGHLERSIYRGGETQYRNMATALQVRKSLVNQGFDVDTVSLAKQDLPDGTTALVIADPRLPFSAVELDRVQRYVDKGGNLFVLGEPGQQDILNPLLQSLPVQFQKGIVVQGSKEFAPDLLNAVFTPEVDSFSKWLSHWQQDSIALEMAGTAPLVAKQNAGFAVQTLLTTDPRKNWIRRDTAGVNSVHLLFDKMLGDTIMQTPVLVALSRQQSGRSQHILVAGDADFLDEQRNGLNPFKPNSEVFDAVFRFLSNSALPIDAGREKTNDTKFSITSKELPIIRFVFLVLLPVILLIGGCWLLITRQRR